MKAIISGMVGDREKEGYLREREWGKRRPEKEAPTSSRVDINDKGQKPWSGFAPNQCIFGNNGCHTRV